MVQSTSTGAALPDRVALVVGASRGVGRVVAEELAASGAVVAVACRSRALSQGIVEDILGSGGRAMAFEIDPMEPESLSALTAEINRRLGPIEILVNNTATITPLGSTADLSLSKILQAFIINVVSVMTLSTAVLPQMSAGRWGRIVNVTAGLGGDTARLPGANIYATTMAAVEAHTLHLAAELEGSGVTVNVFRPGRTSIDADLWIRGVRHRPSDDELITRFARALSQDHVVSPHHSGQILTPNLAGDETGQIWRATTPDSASR